MAEAKPSIKVWPMTGQLQKGQSKTLDIILENGATDYDVEIVSTTKLQYDKAQKRLTSKSAGGVGNGITAKFTPKKDSVLGDPVTISVDIIEGQAAADKPVLSIVEGQDHEMQVSSEKPITIQVQPSNATYTFVNKRADVVEFIKNGSKLKTKTTVTAGTEYEKAYVEFTPKIGEDVVGEMVYAAVKTVAAPSQPATELTLSAESGSVDINGKVLVDVTTNATEFRVESKDTNKATVRTTKTVTGGKGQFEITGKAAGEVRIEVKATKSGASETMKVYTATVQEAAPAPKPSLTVEPQQVTIKQDATQVLTINLANGATDFDVGINQQEKIGFDKGSKTITGKQVTSDGTITLTPKKDSTLGDPVVVNVTVEAKEQPAPETVFSVSPQVVTIVNKQKQVFTLANEGNALKVECNPADAIEWNAGEKAITAKRTGQFAVKFIKSESEVITVNLTVSPEPSVWDKFQNIADVKALLAKGDVTPKDKFDQLDNSVSQYGSLVQSLSTYNAKMGPSVPNILPKNGAGQNYNLLNQIMYVVELSNKEDFTVQFDIINLYFKEYKNEAYKEHSMQRFDNYWIWDTKALNTWMNLVTCICSLCDIATRQENLKKISLDKVLDPTTTLFSPTAIANIKSYYMP